MSNPAQGAVGAETMTAGQSLDLRDLHAANIARQAEWCPEQVPDLSFRGNELGGECGEAQNVIKKLERERQGWRGSRATKDDLADELADVVICADLCAVTADIDLGAAVRRKFNATSEKQGLSVFLPSDPAALASPRTDSAERAAGEVRAWPASYQETFNAIAAATKIQAGMISVSVRDFYRALSYPDRPTASTPATPPGVPDSVRALSEDETKRVVREGMAKLWDAEEAPSSAAMIRAGKWDDTDPVRSAIQGALFLREAIATHPAGQSTGQGAEAVTLTGAPGNRLAPWLLSGTDEEVIEALMRRSAGDVARLFFPTPVNVADPIRRTYYEGRAPRQQRLLAELLRRLKPAPVSTRTGDEGTAGQVAFYAYHEKSGAEWSEISSLGHAQWERAAAAVLAARRPLLEARERAAAIIRRYFFDNSLLTGGTASDAAACEILADIAPALAARPAAPEAQGAEISQAAQDVLAERRRQVEEEGWTPEHDDTHSRCEMASAAACYATAPSPIRVEREWTYPDAPANWPWCRSWWKPRFYRRNLVKAAALLIAEIERWDRLPAPPSSGQGGR